MTLEGAPSTTLAGGDGAASRGRGDVIAVAVAAESVGVAQRAMEMAVEHARDRKQFGRPIGVFQAVSHPCAQMLLEAEGARSAVLFAAWALDDSPEEAPLAAAMAKAYASDAGRRVPAVALQVLGGIGFTWEHDLHFWLKRGRANAAACGRRALAPVAGGGSARALSRARPSRELRVQVLRRRRHRAGGDRRQRRQPLLALDAADLAGVAELRQARDLALALDAGGVAGRQAGDQPRDAVADLQREVRRRGAHELADVVERDLVVGAAADGMLGFGHRFARTANPSATS